jgi:DtxR family Mn-dependent transcriptional regulator
MLGMSGHVLGPERGDDPPASSGHLSESAARYLEAIYYGEQEGEAVRPSRLAEWLGVSAPTVSVTLQRLEREGWLFIAPNRTVSLTPQGQEAASRVVRRHRIVERWLTDVLGLDWAAADHETRRLAPGISDLVLERLDESLGRPETCPHGNAIPGRQSVFPLLVALNDLEPHRRGRVVRISELAEHDLPQLLEFLEGHGIVPGAEVEVEETELAAGALGVKVGGGQVIALGPSRARAVLVELEPATTAARQPTSP